MKSDLKRHKLLKILSEKTLKFTVDELPAKEAIGVSFDEILKLMKCDKTKLNLIAAELYKNKEIGYHNANSVIGMYCDKNGLSSLSNAKYRARYWKDFWNNLFTISQIIVPILALSVALITVLDSRQSKKHTEEILLLRKELNKQQELLNFQTNKILILENILKNDSSLKTINN